ncbi:phage holin family protein [Pseudochryseolinea flava]|uniref:Phage holin family protein n=1 Tax=Pseudochryseolinea flava TaxID=2059302 RepID=A0A364YAP2_9BACT|nr:phage holin family protein [Pseudochryseolinea flava]RAW03379.1 hypothetical protein DQQ10_04645 [Pseudochryseolinea flava]
MIKETIAKFLRLDGIMSNLTGYIEARIELMKVEIKEDVAKALSKAVVFAALAFVFALFILFVSTAVAYKIAEVTSPFIGFMIVAGFYLIAGLVLWLSREGLKNKMENQFNENFKLKKK